MSGRDKTKRGAAVKIAKLLELLEKPQSDEFVSRCLISPIVSVPTNTKPKNAIKKAAVY